MTETITTGTAQPQQTMDAVVRSLLRCPLGHAPLVEEAASFRCPCGRTFPVREGIITLLVAPEANASDTLVCQLLHPSR